MDGASESSRRLEGLLAKIGGVRVVGRASGAAAAVAAIRRAKPEVVLVDLVLEEGSGFDVLREVHRREPGIGLYIVSNYADEPYRRHAMRLGAVDFFDRTTELARLEAVLAARSALTRRRVAPL